MGFELDEILYGKVLKYLKRKRENDITVLSRKMELADVKSRMTLIARAVCGTPIEVFPAEREGGYKDDNFFLPSSFHLFSSKDENLQFYIFRTLYLCVQKQLNLNWETDTYNEELSSQKAIEVAPQVLKSSLKITRLCKNGLMFFTINCPKTKKRKNVM